MIVGSECFVAVGAFAHTRLQTLFDAISAEDMTACFHRSVLEIFTADSADGKVLESVSIR